MIDLTGHLSRTVTEAYYNGSSVVYRDRIVPSTGTDLVTFEDRCGTKYWRPAAGSAWYLNQNAVNGRSYEHDLAQGSGIQPGFKWFITNVNPSTTPGPYPTDSIILTNRGFYRAVDNLEEPIHFGGWIRVHTLNTGAAETGVKFLFGVEDLNRYYRFNALATDGAGNPVASSIDKIDIAGAGTTQTLATSSFVFTIGLVHRFDVIMQAGLIRAYMDGVNIMTVSDQGFGQGSIGFDMRNTHADFGDISVRGEVYD